MCPHFRTSVFSPLQLPLYLDQCSSSGGGKKLLDSTYILKVETTEFTHEKEGMKEKSQGLLCFDRSEHWKLPLTEEWKNAGVCSGEEMS